MRAATAVGSQQDIRANRGSRHHADWASRELTTFILGILSHGGVALSREAFRRRGDEEIHSQCLNPYILRLQLLLAQFDVH